jgi:hypothetical protein
VKKAEPKNLAASIRQRLLNLAKARGEPRLRVYPREAVIGESCMP